MSDNNMTASLYLSLIGLLHKTLGIVNEERQLATFYALLRCFTDLVVDLQPSASLEIGAHEGNYSRTLAMKAKAARSRIDIAAFEANPRVHAKFHDVMEQVGVKHFNKVICDGAREVLFTVPADASGQASELMGSLLKIETAQTHSEFLVDGVTLESVLPPDSYVLWVDVEGALREVFSTVLDDLRNCLAMVIELETKPMWPGQWLAEDFLSFCSRHRLVPIMRDMQHDWQYNVVLVRDDLVLDPRVERFCACYFEEVQTICTSKTNTSL